MGMAMGSGGGQSADMNVTPLIDVLLVLIIIFMVITPLTPKGLEALVPQPPPPNQKPNQSDQRTVVIVVDKDHHYQINQEAPTPEEQLGQRLEDIFKNRNEHIMFIKGASTLPFADVAEIIDISKGAGADKIGLITKQIEEQQ